MQKVTISRNVIYYLDSNDSIKQEFVYQPKKLKISEGKNHLTSKGIQFNSLLKILLEEYNTMIPLEYLGDEELCE